MVLRQCLSLQGYNSVLVRFRIIRGVMRGSSSGLGKIRRILYFVLRTFVGITEGKGSTGA